MVAIYFKVNIYLVVNFTFIFEYVDLDISFSFRGFFFRKHFKKRYPYKLSIYYYFSPFKDFITESFG